MRMLKRNAWKKTLTAGRQMTVHCGLCCLSAANADRTLSSCRLPFCTAAGDEDEIAPQGEAGTLGFFRWLPSVLERLFSICDLMSVRHTYSPPAWASGLDIPRLFFPRLWMSNHMADKQDSITPRRV